LRRLRGQGIVDTSFVHGRETTMREVRKLCLGGALTCALTLGFIACGTGPETGTLQVVMTGGGSATGAVVPVLSIAAGPGHVPPESIESIVLTIARIDLKPTSEPDDDLEEGSDGEDESESGDESEENDDDLDDDGDGKWIRLPVPQGTTIDLLALPAVDGQEVAEGEVTATSFKEVRLVCDGPAMITLKEQVTLPGGVVIGDDESLTQPLRIPSCESSGLKIKGATFVVPAEGEGTIAIELTTDATIQSIRWNAEGFRMSPVMKLKKN
jgi:hypothetical protein